MLKIVISIDYKMQELWHILEFVFFSQVQCELSLRNCGLLDGPKQNTVVELQALEW